MEKIASFQVNHLTLVPGVYVSRRDKVGSETLTTFDLRMTRPNKEPVMNTAEVHTLEHLGATFYAIILYGRIASFILDRWDAELDFI